MRILLAFVLLVFVSSGVVAQYTPLPHVKLKTFYGKEIDASFLNNGREPSIIVLTAQKCPPCDRQVDSILSNKTQLEEKYGARVIVVVQNFFKDDKYTFEDLKNYASGKNWGTEVYIDENAGFLKWLKKTELPIVMYSYDSQMYGFTKGAQTSQFNTILLENYKGNKRWFNSSWNLTLEGSHDYYREINPIMNSDSAFEVKDFYKNGKVQMEGAYLNIGRETKEGKFVWYEEDGVIKEIAHYKRGALHGPNKTWSNGIPTSVKSYENGLLNGIYKYFYEDGKVWSIHEYKQGDLWNIKGTWDKNGNPMQYGTLVDGTGSYYSYTESGVLERIYNYKNGEKDGVTKLFNSKGNFLADNFYSNGLRNSKLEYEKVGEAISKGLIAQKPEFLNKYSINEANALLVLKSELSDAEVTQMISDIPSLIKMSIEEHRKELKKAKIDVIQHHGEMINTLVFNYSKEIENESLSSSQIELEIGLKSAKSLVKFKAIIKKIDYIFYIVESIEIKPE